MRFLGKKVMVTGATSGIGREIALSFAAEGAEVILIGRDVRRGQEILASIEANGSSGRFYACDLSEEINIQELQKQVTAEYDSLDVLVNCAGIWKTYLLEQITQATFDEVFKVNTGSVVFMTKYFMDMLEKARGCIVNIASVGGLHSKISGKSQYLYAASKAAVIQFSGLCALNYAGKVRVNCICPGLTDTPIFVNRDFSRFKGQIPIGRMGKPEDQASATLFLASEEASFITGAVLTVDGGASLV